MKQWVAGVGGELAWLLGLSAGAALLVTGGLWLSGHGIEPIFTSRTVVLDDGTRIEARTSEELTKVRKERRGQVRSIVMQGETRGIGLHTALVISAVFLVAIGYTCVKERENLARWLRLDTREILAGLAAGCGLVGFGLGYSKLIEVLGLELPEVASALTRVIPSSWLLALMAVVLAPIAEELYFRGRLFEAVQGRRGVARAVMVTSLVFAAIHFIPPLLPGYMVYGIVLAALRVKFGGLVPSMIAHAVNNGVFLFLLDG